jgi:hypothetical protein
MNTTKSPTGKSNHLGKKIGQWHHRAKIPDRLINEIVAAYKPYVFGYRSLSRKFAVAESTVRDWITGRTRWAR